MSCYVHLHVMLHTHAYNCYNTKPLLSLEIGICYYLDINIGLHAKKILTDVITTPDITELLMTDMTVTTQRRL